MSGQSCIGGCSAVILFFLCITQGIVGFQYIGYCPGQPFIPIYLSAMLGGTVLLILGLCSWCLCGVGIVFYFFWFIAGNVCIYSLYSYDNRNCDETLYLFAFWSTNFTYILLGLIFCSLCCDQPEPDTDEQRHVQSVADDEVFLPNDEIWVYDLERGVWEVFHMTGEVPPSMSGTCGCSLNGHMYIFGGCGDNGQTNQIYCVNLTDGKYTWRKIMHEIGSAPSPRDKLSCWVHNGRLIYFGGYGHKLLTDVDSRNRSFIVDEASWVEDVFWGWNNEVHIFDPMQASWSEPRTHGRAPAPRAAHASATVGCRGYICGGRVMETRTSDVHCLDLESWTWSEITPASTTPVGRSWHTLTAVSDNTLFLFGGLSVDCKPMSDGWLLDVETKKWREVEHPFKNKPRLWHTACPGKDSDVIVFGGSCDYILLVDTGHCNDALVFQMQPYPLFRICEDYIAKNVRNYEMLRNQLPLLPPKLLTAVQKRMSFYRPSKKQKY